MLKQAIDNNRVKILNNCKESNGTILYWMQRDHRLHNNWAALYAQEKAKELDSEWHTACFISPTFLSATSRQYDFMFEGLQSLEKELQKYKIPFFVFVNNPADAIIDYVKRNKVAAVVTDFSPLKIVRDWKEKVAQHIDVPLYEVDAHNIVPCLVVSQKQEYAARTLRPKIHKLLPKFLVPYPEIEKQKTLSVVHDIDWQKLRKQCKVKQDKFECKKYIAGEEAALKQLDYFIAHALNGYSTQRNDPTFDGQSNLSPYLHFGHISAQRVALKIMDAKVPAKDKEVFLEELIVRKELSDNYCFYNNKYDQLEGVAQWAQDTLKLHAKDKREYLYSQEQLEKAKTHDLLWNAAQKELTSTGKMHGYMRMYWAKKILEWTEAPIKAFQIALYLNDTYSLDGNDPNGYVGVAWSIGGLHDRPWFKRPIFGTIRYMSFNGCKSKFDVDTYVQRKVGLFDRQMPLL